MSQRLARPKGTFDILPESWCGEPWKSSALWRYTEQILHRVAERFGFDEIRTPIFESTDLFQRGVGPSSDIVSKEMYTFGDRSQRSLTLRPEGTLGAVRAIVENGGEAGDPNYRNEHRLYYMESMFRYERPQAGRYRQFHQFGVEAVGLKAWQSDVEIVDLALNICKSLGIEDVQLQINTLGSSEDRLRYKGALQDYLTPHKGLLSEVSQRRLRENPLRILDSKEPQDRELILNAPTVEDHLSAVSKERFAKIVQLLQRLAIPHVINPQLVRGLDYYSHTVFELVSASLGAQSSLGGGGRYDDLFEMLGQKARPAIGFGFGLERLMQAMQKGAGAAKGCDLYLIGLSDEAICAQFFLAQQVRGAGRSAIVHTESSKLQKALQAANSCGARWVAIAGDQELRKEGVQLRDMVLRKERFCPIDQVVSSFGLRCD